MLKKIYLILGFMCLSICGCSSQRALESGKNPLNRSVLIDTEANFGLKIPGIELPIPELKIGFKFHSRRLSPDEEIDLELAKKGKFRGEKPIPIELPKEGPKPMVLNAH